MSAVESVAHEVERDPLLVDWIAVEPNSMLEARKRAGDANERSLQRLTEAQRLGNIGDWALDLSIGAITRWRQTFEILERDPRLGPPGSYEENAAMYEAASAALRRTRSPR